MNSNSYSSEKENKVLLACIILFSVFSFVASYNASLSFSVLALILIIIVLFSNKSCFIGLFIGVANFSSFFVFNFRYFSLTLNLILSLITIFSLLVYIKKIKIDSITLSVYVFLLLSLFLMLQGLNYGLMFSFYLNILIFLVFYNLPQKTFNPKYIFKSLSIFTFIIINLVFIAITVNPYIGNVNTGRISLNSMVNYNRLGMAMVIYGLIMLHGFIINLKITRKILCMIGYLVSIYIIIQTGSRNSLLAVLLLLLLYSIFELRLKANIKNIVKNCFYFVMLIALLYYAQQIIINVERLSLNSILSDGGSGRLESVLLNISTVIPNNFLIGIGFGQQEIYLNQIGYNHVPAAHNIIISSLAELGIIGFFALWYIILKALYLFIKKRSKYTTSFLGYIIFGLLFLGIGETVYTERILWVALGLFFNIINSGMERGNESIKTSTIRP